MLQAVRLAASLFCLSAIASAAPAQDIPEGELPEGGPEPTHYSLSFVIDPERPGFSGATRISVENPAPRDFIWLHGADIDPQSVTVTPAGGEPISGDWSQVTDLGLSRIDLESEMPAGPAVIDIAYAAPFNQSLAGLYRVDQGGESYIITQMEPIDARRAFPSFDQPSFKTPFDIDITAPEGAAVVINTPEVSAEPAEDGWTRHVFATTEPLPTYLIAIGVGPYDVTPAPDLPPTDVRDRPVPLRGFAPAGKGDLYGYTLANTRPILEALEAYFAEPYPYRKLDVIAAPDFAAGAMENAGAITYRETLMLLGDEPGLSQARSYAYVHAHELAHQWFGDLVTPVWWTDIWLNEAFATWMGRKAVIAAFPEGEYERVALKSQLGAMATDALPSTRQIREPVTRDADIDNAFDGITYQKGSGVLDMFENYVGEDAFQEGVRLHIDRFRDANADAEDFFASIADGTGDPAIAAAFSSFVEQPGLPLVSAEWSCGGGGAEVTLTQSRYFPLGVDAPEGSADQTWMIPVRLAWAGPDGERRETSLMLDERSETVTLEACPVWLLPNGGAAGYYRFAMAPQAWSALIAAAGDFTPAEQMVVYDNAAADFQAGRADAGLWLEAVEMAAGAEAYDVVSLPLSDLAAAHDRRLDAEGRADLRAAALDWYAPAFARAQQGDDLNAALLEVALAPFMALYARSEDAQAGLLADAERALGLDGAAPEPDALSSDMRSAGFAVLARERGEPAFEAVLESILESTDQNYREESLQALAETTDPELGARLLGVLAGEDLTGREAGRVYALLMANPDQRDQAWAWMQDHYDSFAQRVPGFRRPDLIGASQFYCDAEMADEAAAFYDAHAGATTPGYELPLQLTTETIRSCAAWREATGAALSAALAEAAEG